MNPIPSRMRARSKTFALMFLSLNISTPQMKDIITELRRTRDTTEIMDSGSLKDVKYAKSPMHMNMEINGMDHFHVKGVLLWRDGYQISPHMRVMMII